MPLKARVGLWIFIFISPSQHTGPWSSLRIVHSSWQSMWGSNGPILWAHCSGVPPGGTRANAGMAASLQLHRPAADPAFGKLCTASSLVETGWQQAVPVEGVQLEQITAGIVTGWGQIGARQDRLQKHQCLTIMNLHPGPSPQKSRLPRAMLTKKLV